MQGVLWLGILTQALAAPLNRGATQGVLLLLDGEGHRCSFGCFSLFGSEHAEITGAYFVQTLFCDSVNKFFKEAATAIFKVHSFPSWSVSVMPQLQAGFLQVLKNELRCFGLLGPSVHLKRH